MLNPTMITTDDNFLFQQEGHVATITINRAEKHNTWHPGEMGPVFERMVRACADDDSVRVIVITGAGRHFCTGADVQALKAAQASGANPFPLRERNDEDFNQRYSFLMAVPKPIICAINGAAAGIGVVLPLFCDIRYAASSAKLSAMFARRGLVAEHGIAWLLSRMIGLPRAMEWLMSGRTIGADEAERFGLVNAVFADATFQADVMRCAQELANNVSPRSVRIIKRQVYDGTRQSLAQAVHAAEDELQGCIESEDLKEGVAHFLEKRPARFTGR